MVLKILLFSVFVIGAFIGLFFLLKKIRPLFSNFFPYKTIYAGIIMAVLLFGFAFTFVDIKESSATENRNLAAVPDFSKIPKTQIPSAIDEFVQDHFGGRELLVDLYRDYKMGFWNKPLTKGVYAGLDGWFYKAPMVKRELYNKETVKDMENVSLKLNYLDSLLKSKGINLYIAVIPAKFYAYPEYLPNWIDISKNFRQTPLSFVEAINQYTDIPIIDLYDSIIKAKDISEYPLYWKTDSHWNPLGATFGIKAILSFINEHENTALYVPENEFIELSKKTDLYRMMGYAERREVNIGPKPANNSLTRIPAFDDEFIKQNDLRTDWRQTRQINSSGGNNSIKPAVFTDSYILGNSNNLFQNAFNESIFGHYQEVLAGIDYIIENDKDIDIVVLSFVDRNLNQFKDEIEKLKIPNTEHFVTGQSLGYNKYHNGEGGHLEVADGKDIVKLPRKNSRILFIQETRIPSDSEILLTAKVKILKGNPASLYVGLERHGSSEWEFGAKNLSDFPIIDGHYEISFSHQFKFGHEAVRALLKNTENGLLELEIKSIEFKIVGSN